MVDMKIYDATIPFFFPGLPRQGVSKNQNLRHEFSKQCWHACMS